MKSTVIVERKGKAKSAKAMSAVSLNVKTKAKPKIQKAIRTVIAAPIASTAVSMPEMSLSDLLPSIKESLLFQKSQILNRTNEFKRSQQESVQLSDEAEVASNDLSNNLSIHLHERSMKALMEIDSSLNKMSVGTYGECECCGDNIHPKRLQARPLARLCISCMEEREEESRTKQQ